MDLRKLFIGGLCASAVLAGCTKELSAPSVEGNQAAVSLGEGLTITGSKGSFGAETKAVYDSKLNPTWEESDMLGAAWYNPASKQQNGQWKPGTNFDGFMSNTWFKFDKWVDSGKKQADFTAEANLFAGAYVLYYPYKKDWTDIKSSIPVTISTTQEMDTTPGNEYKHLGGDNMFFYTTYAATPGGAQLDKRFEMKPLVNVLDVKFYVKEQRFLDQMKGLDIDMVVIEYTPDPNVSNTSSFMFSGGAVTASKEVITDFDDLPNALYEGNKTTSQIILNVKGSGTGYALTALGQENATKSFYVSALPWDKIEKATDITVKAVTKDGVFSGHPSNEALETAINGVATEEGKHVHVNIVIDNYQGTGEIYTASEFKSQWNAAVKKGNGTLKVKTPITNGLDDFDLNLKNGEEITITGSNVTVGNLNITKGTLTFDNTLTVKDLTLGTGSDITGGTLAVSGKTSVDSKDAKITVSKIGEIAVSKTGTLTVTGASTLVTMGAVQNEGTLTLSNVNVSNLTNDETVVMQSNVVVTGTLTNNGTLTGMFENHGVVNINKAVNYSKLTIKNCGSVAGHSRGVVNVNVDQDFLDITNDGEIKVKPGKILMLGNSYSGSGVINAQGATVTLGGSLSSSNQFKGNIVADKETTIEGIDALEKKVTLLVEDKEYSQVSFYEKVRTLRVMTSDFDYKPKFNDGKIYHVIELCEGAKWIVSEQMEFDPYYGFTVLGNASIVAKDNAASVTLAGESEVAKGAVLTLDGSLNQLTVSGTILVHAEGAVTTKGGSNVVTTGLTTIIK